MVGSPPLLTREELEGPGLPAVHHRASALLQAALVPSPRWTLQPGCALMWVVRPK